MKTILYIANMEAAELIIYRKLDNKNNSSHKGGGTKGFMVKQNEVFVEP